MPDSGITRELRDLIDHHLGALDEIEVLLAVFARRGQLLYVSETADLVRKPAAAVQPLLERLAKSGFLVHHQPGDRYSYPERESAVDDAVQQLATLYEQRPATLIRALYDRPSKAVLSFADAFRLRND